MNSLARRGLDPYLKQLQQLIGAESIKTGGLGQAGDVLLEIKTRAGRRYRYVTRLIRTPRLSMAPVAQLASELRVRDSACPLLLAEFIPAELRARLTELGIDYLDAAGNCHLAPDETQMIHIDGQKPTRPRTRPAIGPLGYKVLFAILAKPNLVAEPIREIARLTGIGKTATGQLIERLVEEGHVRDTKRGRVLPRPQILLQRWVTGYDDVLRPGLLLQRYQAPEAGRREIPDRIRKYFAGLHQAAPWGFGGAIGGDALTHHYGGTTVTVHVEEIPEGFARQVQLLPAREGDIHVLKAPAPIAYEGPAQHIVHPLLIYGELLANGNERDWEMASMVLDEHLPWLK